MATGRRVPYTLTNHFNALRPRDVRVDRVNPLYADGMATGRKLPYRLINHFNPLCPRDVRVERAVSEFVTEFRILLIHQTSLK